MKHFNLLFLAVILLSATQFESSAQTSTMYDANANPLMELKTKKYVKRLKGDHYISSDWQIADVKMTNSSNEFKDVHIKMDVTSNVVELKMDDEIKILPSYKVEQIQIKTYPKTTYVSKTQIGASGPLGFYRVVYDGKTKLYCYYSTEIKESTYNVALDTGDKDDKIVLNKEHYILDANHALVKLQRKKSKLQAQLHGDDGMIQFIKENGLNLKVENDLLKLMKYTDSQTN